MPGTINQPVIDFLLSRKSPPISEMREPAPDDAELLEILKIATRVPDHAMLEPWRFITYRGEARARIGEYLAKRVVELEGDVPPHRIEQEKGRFTRAPLVIGVISVPKPHPRVPDWEKFISGGNAAFALVLAVHAHGYAANWVSNWFADDAKSRAFMGVADGEQVIGYVHIGTPANVAPDRPRPDPSTLVSAYAGPWEG